LIASFVVVGMVRTELSEETASTPKTEHLKVVKTLDIHSLRVRVTQLLRHENSLVATQRPEPRAKITNRVAQPVQRVRQLPRKPGRGHRTRRRIRRTASIQLLSQRACGRRPNILVRVEAGRIEHHENRARHRSAGVDVHGRQHLALLPADKAVNVLLRRAEPISDLLKAQSTLRKHRADRRDVGLIQRYARHPVTVTFKIKATRGNRKTPNVVACPMTFSTVHPYVPANRHLLARG
jgi:hypothetical protein